MVTLGYSLGPLLVLAGVWLLLLAHANRGEVDRRRAVQAGAGALVLALAVTAGAAAGDRPPKRGPVQQVDVQPSPA